MRARSLGFIAALVMFFGLAAVAYAQTSCGVTPADVRACLARGDHARVPKQNHNTAPIANAGPDQSVFLGETVIVDGSASTDPDGGPVLFYWTLVSRPPGSTATLAPTVVIDPRASFVVDQEGTYTLELVVADYRSKSPPDIVVVSTSNTRPVANPKASCAAAPNVDCSAPIGSTITLDASASTDVDGNALSYKWSLVTRPPGSGAALSAPTSIATTFATDAPGNFVAQLIVNDGSLDSVPKTVMVTSTNVKPVAAATINPTSLGALPQSVQLDGSGSTDPEGQGLTYAWSILTKPAGSAATLSSATTVAPTFVADVLGTYTAQLIVNDGFLSSTPVTVSASSANQPPVANAGPDQAVSAGATVQLTSAGSNDPEGSPLGYFWSMLNKPSGSTTDFNNANAANPTFVADRKGTFVAQLIVNDGALNSAPDTVQVTAGNNAPVAAADTFSVAQDGSLVVGAATGVLANDTDADGDALTAILVGAAPSGFLLSANGGFTYTPPAGFNGATTFQYKANDGTADSNTVTSTINVTAGLPTVSIVATTPNASETGPVSGMFTFTRTGPTTFDLTVSYAIGGTAQNFFDYQSISGSVTIPAGQASATVTITPVADASIEGNETVILTINPSPTTYLVGAASSATVTIADGVPNTVSIAATTPNASETGPVSGVFTFTRTGPTTFDVTVNYAIGGTAQNFFDYQSISGSVTIPAGQTSATVTITPVADASIEGNETVILTINPSPTTYLVGAASSATVTIADGVPNTVTHRRDDAERERDGARSSGVFTFTRTGPTDVRRDRQLRRSAARPRTASTITSISGSVTIPAGQTSATVTITPMADASIEGNETVILTINAEPDHVPGRCGEQRHGDHRRRRAEHGEHRRDDAERERDGTGERRVHVHTHGSDRPFDVTVSYAIGGTAQNFFDYQSISGSVTIPAGQTSATVTITSGGRCEHRRQRDGDPDDQPEPDHVPGWRGEQRHGDHRRRCAEHGEHRRDDAECERDGAGQWRVHVHTHGSDDVRR